MHYHYTKYIAVLNRIEEPTPKYMVELFVGANSLVVFISVGNVLRFLNGLIIGYNQKHLCINSNYFSPVQV